MSFGVAVFPDFLKRRDSDEYLNVVEINSLYIFFDPVRSTEKHQNRPKKEFHFFFSPPLIFLFQK